MTKKSCIYIPDKLFGDILKIMGGDRGVTKILWSLSQSKTAKEQFGINEKMSASEVIEKIGNKIDLKQMLTDRQFSNYIQAAEKLDEYSFESYGDLKNKQQDIRNKYDNVIPIAQNTNGNYRIEVQPKDSASKKAFAKQRALENMNGRLIDYIERLGFAVREVEGLGMPGVFSPLDAETNAQGLKEVIRIAKTNEGRKALPEEISHLLVEGFQNNPLMSRLMNAMTEDVVMEILGEQFQEYNELYDGDETLLKKEAVGKMVAQNIVDRNGLHDDIRFISSKVLDKIKSNLKNGSEHDIDRIIMQLDGDINDFVNYIFGREESIDLFDKNLIDQFKDRLYFVRNKMRTVQDIAEKNYNITAKRMKLLSLKRKDYKLTKEEMRQFDNMRQLMEKKDYSNACLEFIKYTLEDCKSVYNNIESLRDDYNNGRINGLKLLKGAAGALRQADDLIQAYENPIQSMQSIGSIQDVASQLPAEDIEELQNLASETVRVINDIKGIVSDLRMNILAKLLENYWGKDKKMRLSDGTETSLTLYDVLESNVGETFSVSRLLNSLADAGDPMLQLIDMMFKDFTNQRDKQIFSLQQELATIQSDYMKKTGSRDMRVLYARDKDGKFTGMLKSDRDYLRFHKEKREYRQQLKDQGLTNDEIKSKLKVWDINHTEMVNVAPEGSQPKMERMPRLDMYKSNDLDSLTQDQRELYDKIIGLKKRLDMLLPNKYTHLYRAPMKKGSVKDQAMSGGSLKGMLNRIKSRYFTNVDNAKKPQDKQNSQSEPEEGVQTDQSTEYGEAVQIDQYVKGKHVVLDFSGKEVKKIPVFYTQWLDDMSALDTNLIDTMLSYGAMALNYKYMNDVSDFMELGNSQMQDREIIKTSGLSKMYERFKLGDTAFENDYVIKGSQSEQAKMLRSYTDRNVYGLKKNKETITIGGKQIDLGNIGDALKNYNSIVGLGLNVFSGTTNLTMGIAQTILQTIGGQNFKIGDVMKANKLYFKELPKGIMGQYQDVKKDKLNLLIQKFDCLEEYYNQLEDNNFYGGIFKKIVGKWNPLILNSMGEHYLHCISMIAILNKTKVKIGENGELMSLYDALEVKNKNIQGIGNQQFEGYEITIPENLMKEDGTAFDESDILDIKRQIQDVNHRMHGAFNDVDRGDANKWVIGRALMQFRQWMPAFYTQRFRKERINVMTGESEEGFYNTYFKFVAGYIEDCFRLKFNVLTKYKKLTNTQKANVRMAFFESTLALLLLAITKMKFAAPDKDDPAFANIVRYNLYRLKMELGAASPINVLDFIDNITTLVQSPLPMTENIDRLISIVDVTLIGGTIKTGRYAGWNKYLRNLYFATPMAKNIGRLVDLIEGDVSMFNPYIKHK